MIKKLNLKLKTYMLIQKELNNDEINNLISLPRSSGKEIIQNLKVVLEKNFLHTRIVS